MKKFVVACWVLQIFFAGSSFAQSPCANPLDSRLARSCIVQADTLWRGAKPTAQGAKYLVEQGVGSVVNLELLNDDLPAFQEAEIHFDIKREITYLRLRDWEPWIAVAPKKVDENVVNFLASVNALPKPIYVHCRSGQNRTGIMVAAFRISRGDDLETVVRDMGAYKGIWFKHAERYIRSFAARKTEMLKRVDAKAAQLRESGPKNYAMIVCSEGRCKAKKS